MKKLLDLLCAALSAVILTHGAACAGIPPLTGVEMPVYVDGEEKKDGGIFTDGAGGFYADIEALRRWISPDFARVNGDGVWMIRRIVPEKDAVVYSEGRAFLDLGKADFCLRTDPYWLEAGVFSLLVRFSPVLTADGGTFERTGETMPRPAEPCGRVSPEGRGMWMIGGDWWVEDDDGLAWRYTRAEGAENGPDGDAAR